MRAANASFGKIEAFSVENYIVFDQNGRNRSFAIIKNSRHAGLHFLMPDWESVMYAVSSLMPEWAFQWKLLSWPNRAVEFDGIDEIWIDFFVKTRKMDEKEETLESTNFVSLFERSTLSGWDASLPAAEVRFLLLRHFCIIYDCLLFFSIVCVKFIENEHFNCHFLRKLTEVFNSLPFQASKESGWSSLRPSKFLKTGFSMFLMMTWFDFRSTFSIIRRESFAGIFIVHCGTIVALESRLFNVSRYFSYAHWKFAIANCKFFVILEFIMLWRYKKMVA